MNPYENYNLEFKKLSTSINEAYDKVLSYENKNKIETPIGLSPITAVEMSFDGIIPSLYHYDRNSYSINGSLYNKKGDDSMKGIEARVEIEVVSIDKSDVNNPKLSYETLFFNNIESYNEDKSIAVIDGKKIENIRFLQIDENIIWNKHAPKIVVVDSRKEHLENAMNYFRKRMEIDMSLVEESTEEKAQLASLDSLYNSSKPHFTPSFSLSF